jgi:hypothetical protein
LEPASFRRDPYLRSSAYHLATWSLVAFVLELRGATSTASTTSASAQLLLDLPVTVVLMAGAAMTSLTHERRVGKMVGPAGEALFAAAGRMWLALFAALAAASALLLAASKPQLLFDAWVVGVGSGFVVWGSKARFAWYMGLGAATVATAVLDMVLWSAGMSVLELRCLLLALALPAAALATNYRFLWFRPPQDR